jgi:hypothetical protein
VIANPLDRPALVSGLRRLASPTTARVLGLPTVLLLLAAVPLEIASHALSQGIVVIPFGAVGYVVARRQPQNPIGWILLVLTLAFVLSGDGGTYSVLYYHKGFHGLPFPRVAVFFAAWWVWLLLLLPLAIGLFPDGRVSGGWRWLFRVYYAGCAVAIAVSTWNDATGVVARHLRVDANGEATSGGGSGHSAVDGILALVYVAFCVACVARQLISYRRSRGEHRQQLKWLLAGGALGITGLLLTLTTKSAVGGFGFGFVMALPVGMGIGILKYRLFEIDRLISRTLSYLIITGLLAGVFVGIVVLATDVLPFSSPVGVAASTLAAAALFNPLRLRVQRLVDRRFNRARYDAEAIVAAFTLRLRDAVDLETVRNELLQAVDRAVEPAHASVWIRPSELR